MIEHKMQLVDSVIDTISIQLYILEMFTTTSTYIVDSIYSMPSLFSFETNHE